MRTSHGTWAVTVAAICFGIVLTEGASSTKARIDPAPRTHASTSVRTERPSTGAQGASSNVEKRAPETQASAVRPEGAADGPPVNFNRDIRPILANNCFACHGPDEKQRETKFHFDTEEGAFAKDGVIERGKSAESLLIEMITHPDPKERMPPADSGYALTDRQIDLLRRWIDQGAKWDTHWAYAPPARPELPAVNDQWVRNPIDRFVLARLEREGLKPSAEADKVTLLRRVTYDLTGLPPTPAEVDAFLADRSPDAYEKRVDALLRSPHYGERMAMPWLDAARYGDTHGYHIDSLRGMWPWRDWVIGAFNRNLPFDQFVIEQLAGDLLPNATKDQKIASGFNRNHMINFEGGAIAAEYQVEYVMDRVEATSSAFMGLTMACARCHSHKFDPITHKEFYQFFAFFNSVPELGLDGRTGNAAPVLQLPSAAQQAQLDEIDAAIKTRQSALADAVVAPLQSEWERTFSEKIARIGVDGLVAQYELDGNFSDISGRYQHGRTVTGDPTFDVGQIGRAVTFDGDTEVSFGDVGAFDRADAFSLAVWMRGRGNQPISVFQKIEDAEQRRGYEWLLEDVALVGIQRWAARLTITLASDPASAIQIRTRDRLRSNDWHHVALTYDGSGQAAGLHLYVNGKRADTEVVRDTLSGTFKTAAPLRVGSKALGKPFNGQLDDLRLYNRALTPEQVAQLAIHYRVRAILSGVTGKPSKDEAQYTREYFLTYEAPDALRTSYAELKALRVQKEELDKIIPSAMVMAEMKSPRDSFVLARGDYRNQTEKVQPGVPAMLPPLPDDAPPNRLTLAKWLVQPGHPLTARVAVNRFWQMYFGHGIVKTQEDFGVQGEAPINQELLDWLATEFIRTGWDTRAMQRLIVTSAAYRQSSKATPALLEKDPENRLLSRGPRVRLPAEMIRDTALAASGLLNEQIGGPSVLPYQPKGLWEEMAFGEGFSAQAYEQSHGKDLYRRGMYTFWKRTVPPASLATFDAPDREKCTARRALTNTPLQALTLLNDPTYVEASRALAQRAIREGGKDVNSRVAYAFRLATARKPTGQETKVLRGLLGERLTAFRRDRPSALKLLSVGESPRDASLDVAELAAWTTVASVILNLDETITK
jgi:mono/diheme cytochrome c family protein